MMSMLFSHPDVYAVVAEVAGQIVGSNFLWEESAIAGVGPTTVALHPECQSCRRLGSSAGTGKGVCGRAPSAGGFS